MSGLTLELHVGDKKAAAIRKQFDYLNDEEFENEDFVIYKGYTYGMCDFMVNQTQFHMHGWDGYHSDSYFSGVLIKYVKDSDCNEVILGTYFS
jgi:hypothetical protein